MEGMADPKSVFQSHWMIHSYISFVLLISFVVICG